VLGSPITEFQAVGATWRFWFLCFDFHIYLCRASYPTPTG
jgi:hypothetical protein